MTIVKRTKTKRLRETDAVVEESKPVWKVRNGGIGLLGQKNSYSKGDTFEAYEWEIPTAFRDLVECLTPTLKVKPVKKEPKYSLREIVPSADEMDEEDFVQMYEIINKDDKVISEPMPKDEAEKAVNKMNL